MITPINQILNEKTVGDEVVYRNGSYNYYSKGTASLKIGGFVFRLT